MRNRLALAGWCWEMTAHFEITATLISAPPRSRRPGFSPGGAGTVGGVSEGARPAGHRDRTGEGGAQGGAGAPIWHDDGYKDGYRERLFLYTFELVRLTASIWRSLPPLSSCITLEHRYILYYGPGRTHEVTHNSGRD
jgi:hypothetical protein